MRSPREPGLTFAVFLLLAALVDSVSGQEKSLENAGNLVKAMASRARAKAITTRDIHYLLFLVGDGTENPVRHTVRAVTDPNAPAREIEGSAGTMILVDENARAGTSRYADWLQTIDEPVRLPRGTAFVRGAGETRYPPAIEIRFFSDGSLVLATSKDHPAETLAMDAARLDEMLSRKEEADWFGSFDLAIRSGDFDAVCLVDLAPNTGRVEFIVHPE